MPKYHLNALGDKEFEQMVQALLKAVIGAGTITFGDGKDGAREATFEGTAQYPSKSTQWSGKWIFQVKFHDIELVGSRRARANIVSDLKNELKRVTEKYKHRCDNYILITNVPLSGVHEKGTIDKIEADVFSEYRSKIPHLAVWGADDVNRLLDDHPKIRTAYLPLLVTGDVIAELLNLVDAPRTEKAITIDSYLRTVIGREENAQLDQAGDVGEDPILLQKVFFDLHAYVEDPPKSALARLKGPSTPLPTKEAPTPLVWLLINSSVDRIVVVGGPGEGKSTLGQYLAQIHRATLLGKGEEVAMSADYIPEVPRLPFRVVLREFAQWLAGRATDPVESDSLDCYIASQVARISSRSFTERDLHETIRANPSLLILDGLDEVTDVSVRKRLLLRISEFLERCENSIHADMQVVATTRPTGYSDQFDPKAFIHCRLDKLKPGQVREYVKKWAIARDLDEAKNERLHETIDECLRDHQIRLLMTTPLQVTILILIINSGGTPPRQREALFDEYLEVIYKREKAKGLGIIQSEKELLIGLHKFVGYLLQEESTRASASSAAMPRSLYNTVVHTYLRKHDPYSPDGEIQAEWKAITLDAGERLVLIVESPANIFGFELRSIQEFFAACYLADTAEATSQRYERFDTIARLPHWRNVALFFAGRVGRNNPGEAANIVEVCRQVDRVGVDIFVRRGAELALELAADRALEPNRVLQRSLLEHGLGIFDSKLSPRTMSSMLDVLHRLPPEDVRDHVLPIISDRLSIVGPDNALILCRLLGAIAPESTLLRRTLLLAASSQGVGNVGDILAVIAAPGIPNQLRVDVVQTLLDNIVTAEKISEHLAATSWDVQCAIGLGLVSSDIANRIMPEFGVAIANSYSYLSPDDTGFHFKELPLHPFCTFLQTAQSVGRIAGGRYQYRNSRQQVGVWNQVASGLPEEIRLGTFDANGVQSGVSWFLWAAHLSFGEVTLKSWDRYCKWRISYEFTEESLATWHYLGEITTPVVALLINADPSSLQKYGDLAPAFSGLSGLAKWIDEVTEIRSELQAAISSSDLSILYHLGLGALAEPAREAAKAILDRRLDERLQAFALDGQNNVGSVLPPVTPEIVRRDLEWFASLAVDSSWRIRDRAFQITASLAGAGSPLALMEPFLSRVPTYGLAQLIGSLSKSSAHSVGITRRVLEELVLRSVADENSDRDIYMHISVRTVRRSILSLIQFLDDRDTRIGDMASRVITRICLIASVEEPGIPPIRNPQLDKAQLELCSSQTPTRREAGIALYSVRPPRSASDWKHVASLLGSADVQEINTWAWVIPKAVDLSSKPESWIAHISSLLNENFSRETLTIMSDILRNLLEKQSQSVAFKKTALGLPEIRSALHGFATTQDSCAPTE